MNIKNKLFSLILISNCCNSVPILTLHEIKNLSLLDLQRYTLEQKLIKNFELEKNIKIQARTARIKRFSLLGLAAVAAIGITYALTRPSKKAEQIKLKDYPLLKDMYGSQENKKQAQYIINYLTGKIVSQASEKKENLYIAYGTPGAGKSFMSEVISNELLKKDKNFECLNFDTGDMKVTPFSFKKIKILRDLLKSVEGKHAFINVEEGDVLIENAIRFDVQSGIRYTSKDQEDLLNEFKTFTEKAENKHVVFFISTNLQAGNIDSAIKSRAMSLSFKLSKDDTFEVFKGLMTTDINNDKDPSNKVFKNCVNPENNYDEFKPNFHLTDIRLLKKIIRTAKTKGYDEETKVVKYLKKEKLKQLLTDPLEIDNFQTWQDAFIEE